MLFLVQILVVGGTTQDGAGANTPATTNSYLLDLSNPASPTWTTEQMPVPRVMGDALLLPNSKVIVVNGAQQGMPAAVWPHSRMDPCTMCRSQP